MDKGLWRFHPKFIEAAPYRACASRGTAQLEPARVARYTHSMTTNVETFQFQAEARQVLDLMIHSLYTHKEIFLRELISNASDALDRLRFEALSRPDLIGPDEKLEIWLESDSKLRTLTISDNGIGMPVRGVFNMQELKTMGVGPRMLQDRVAGLGGELVLESWSKGTTLRITAPLARATP